MFIFCISVISVFMFYVFTVIFLRMKTINDEVEKDFEKRFRQMRESAHGYLTGIRESIEESNKRVALDQLKVIENKAKDGWPKEAILNVINLENLDLESIKKYGSEDLLNVLEMKEE